LCWLSGGYESTLTDRQTPICKDMAARIRVIVAAAKKETIDLLIEQIAAATKKDEAAKSNP
jgi:hypothetical protein